MLQGAVAVALAACVEEEVLQKSVARAASAQEEVLQGAVVATKIATAPTTSDRPTTLVRKLAPSCFEK